MVKPKGEKKRERKKNKTNLNKSTGLQTRAIDYRHFSHHVRRGIAGGVDGRRLDGGRGGEGPLDAAGAGTAEYAERLVFAGGQRQRGELQTQIGKSSPGTVHRKSDVRQLCISIHHVAQIEKIPEEEGQVIMENARSLEGGGGGLVGLEVVF